MWILEHAGKGGIREEIKEWRLSSLKISETKN
jgi:hypothetical protein